MPERKFYVSYGVVGGEDKASDDGEMWNVRRGAMAIAKSGAKAYRDAGQEAAAACYEAIYVRFLEAQVGELMFGLTIEVEIGDKLRFIALCPAGQSRENNQAVDRLREGDTVATVQRRIHPPTSSAMSTPLLGSLGERMAASLRANAPAPAQKPQLPSKAERIADEMAKATKKAVDG